MYLQRYFKNGLLQITEFAHRILTFGENHFSLLCSNVDKVLHIVSDRIYCIIDEYFMSESSIFRFRFRFSVEKKLLKVILPVLVNFNISRIVELCNWWILIAWLPAQRSITVLCKSSSSKELVSGLGQLNHQSCEGNVPRKMTRCDGIVLGVPSWIWTNPSHSFWNYFLHQI